jgi:hypothetical protein
VTNIVVAFTYADSEPKKTIHRFDLS